jgi:hypothetical protein
MLESASASGRAIASLAPPGANGTIILIGLLGKSSCANEELTPKNKTIGSKNLSIVSP